MVDKDENSAELERAGVTLERFRSHKIVGAAKILSIDRVDHEEGYASIRLDNYDGTLVVTP